jgi:hypothetical protein
VLPVSAPETEVVVRAISRRWGGTGASLWKTKDGVWRFRHADPEDGFVYDIYEPGEHVPVFEDDGRPCGTITRPDAFCVRCVNDAPDSWFTVGVDGIYFDDRGQAYDLVSEGRE